MMHHLSSSQLEILVIITVDVDRFLILGTARPERGNGGINFCYLTSKTQKIKDPEKSRKIIKKAPNLAQPCQNRLHDNEILQKIRPKGLSKLFGRFFVVFSGDGNFGEIF